MLVYSLTGVLLGIVAVFLVRFCKTRSCDSGHFYGSYVLMVLGAIAIIFSLDWGYASIIEGEPQAAAIGFLVFGGVGIILALIGMRVASAKLKNEKDGNREAAITSSAE